VTDDLFSSSTLADYTDVFTETLERCRVDMAVLALGRPCHVAQIVWGVDFRFFGNFLWSKRGRALRGADRG